MNKLVKNTDDYGFETTIEYDPYPKWVEILYHLSSRKEGVANKADPTAWTRYTWNIEKLPWKFELSLQVVWDAELRFSLSNLSTGWSIDRRLSYGGRFAEWLAEKLDDVYVAGWGDDPMGGWCR